MDYGLIVRLLEPLNVAEMKTLAERSGVPWETIYRVARRRTTNPKYHTVERLARALSDPDYRAPATPRGGDVA